MLLDFEQQFFIMAADFWFLNFFMKTRSLIKK